MKNTILILLSVPVITFAKNWYEIPQAEVRARISELASAPWKGKYKEIPTEVKSGCLISKIELPVQSRIGESWTYQFKLIRPEKVAKTPLVMIIPTIEGTTPLEKTLAHQFCKAGVSVALTDVNDNSHPKQLPGWNHENKVLRKSIITLRTVLDWVKRDSRFDQKRISLYGQSLGGVTASLLAGIESRRFNSIIVAVGAGNMPGVMTHSIYFRIALLKYRRMLHLRMTKLSEYEQALRDNIRYDPLFFSKHVDKKKTYFVMASEDLSVPFRYQLETHYAFGSPKYHLFSPGSHFDGMIRLATVDFDKILPVVRGQ